MKKTISVNLKGTNFIIEEDAYNRLENYLTKLASKLGSDPGKNDIIEDIELRIAELFNGLLNDRKTVIEDEDVAQILVNLGDPSLYVSDEFEENSSGTEQKASESFKRRLFRDTQNSSIGGVCAGLAHYFTIDIVIVRIIFAVLFFIGGFTIPLYILLWIILPEAKTSIDRLQMHGKAVTIDSVKEEIENATESIKTKSNQFAKNFTQNKDKFAAIGKVIRIIFGSILIFKAIGITILLFTLFFVGFSFSPSGLITFQEMGAYFLTSDFDFTLSVITVLVASISLILFLLILGLKLLLNIQTKWTKYTLILLFTAGIISVFSAAMIGINTAKDFAINGEIERTISTLDTTILHIENNRISPYKIGKEFTVKSDGFNEFIHVEKNRFIRNGIEIEYRRSKDSLFHIIQNLSAQGPTHQAALKKARNIEHFCKLIDGKLVVATGYFFPIRDKMRSQTLKLIIEIPANKSVEYNGKMIQLELDQEEEWDTNDAQEEEYSENGYLSPSGNYEHWD
jgi:phage shock protein PspC (stress-responsive transcriptional regulator)